MQALRSRMATQRKRSSRASMDPAAYASYARNLFEAEPAQAPSSSAVAYAPLADVDGGAPRQQHEWMQQEAGRLNGGLTEYGVITIGAARLALREAPSPPAATHAASTRAAADEEQGAPPTLAEPLKLISEAGPEAHEALLTLLRGSEARAQLAALPVGPLPKGIALHDIVMACRDVLCGVASTIFEAAPASAVRIASDARLQHTSLTASRRLLQRFADIGTQVRRLAAVAAQLTVAPAPSAAALAMGNALQTYLRTYRLQVRRKGRDGQ